VAACVRARIDSDQRWIRPIMLGGPSLLFRVKDEAQMVESGDGVRGGGNQPPSNQLVGLEERCKLPQRGPGRAPAAKRFSCILEGRDSLSRNLFGAKFGGMAPCPHPLKSACDSDSGCRYRRGHSDGGRVHLSRCGFLPSIRANEQKRQHHRCRPRA